MKRILPHPMLSLVLLFMWLLLTRFSLGQLVLGSALAIMAGMAFRPLEPEAVRIRSIPALIRLMAIVSADIVRSNIAVATLILTRGRHGKRKSAFVEIPLQLRDPAPLALLAIILTATPGTAWLEYDSDSGILLLHVFDMVDEDEWRTLIRTRYESLLMEAFA
ncbi:Na+/H+ antiporter subunit E [Paracoccus sp. (in: a-proteobacteria)]|uniref:Na+/H+ antiporter subunit E n=1 Tax=Paracoccus sp. TaxID=267 RepID=UPI0026E073B1|nr:Na+/H+ antiporter subunit E [Paracoccus sp. (in: a-proteobacteria)]MDO5647817.1 Na+/H+ antiporter subunit E [Paracoccus sp. (in: a-proteobacteria)]